MKDKFTLEEALKLLDTYEKIDLIYKNLPKNKKEKLTEEAYFDDNYDDLIAAIDKEHEAEHIKQAKQKLFGIETNEAIQRKGKFIPEIGDIAILKIKINRTSNTDKKSIYDGYERRPVLIIRATSDKVDAVEITHRDFFSNYKLIPIGKIGTNNQYSYINIYTIDDYINLPVSYKFPVFKNNKPISKEDYYSLQIGIIYNGEDKDEPYLVDFTYRDNYIGQLDSETLDKVITALIDYYSGE